MDFNDGYFSLFVFFGGFFCYFQYFCFVVVLIYFINEEEAILRTEEVSTQKM